MIKGFSGSFPGSIAQPPDTNKANPIAPATAVPIMIRLKLILSPLSR